tara:strand:+ start:25604 stop:26119 length:516 start_codon:yes stop_codon:yes gene_type:complete
MNSEEKEKHKSLVLELALFEQKAYAIHGTIKDLHKGYSPSLTDEALTVRENGKVFLNNGMNAFVVNKESSTYMSIAMGNDLWVYKVNKTISEGLRLVGLNCLESFRAFGKLVYTTQKEILQKNTESKMCSTKELQRKKDKIKLSVEEMDMLVAEAQSFFKTKNSLEYTDIN